MVNCILCIFYHNKKINDPLFSVSVTFFPCILFTFSLTNSNWEYLKCYYLGFMKHLLQKIKNYLIKSYFFILCSYLSEFEEEILVVFCFLFVYGTYLQRNTH